MGNSGSTKSGGGSSFLPTNSQLGKCKDEKEAYQLQSKWWDAQKDGTIPAPVSLHAYGQQYAVTFKKNCGKYKEGFDRCVKSSGKDPLNMSTWYGACGLNYELETRCTTELIQFLDKGCHASFDRGLTAVESAADLMGMDRVIGQISDGSGNFPPLKSMNQCIKKVSEQPFTFDEAPATTKYTQNSRFFPP